LGKQEKYIYVEFADQEEPKIREQRLLTELDTKISGLLIELNRFSKDLLKSALALNESNALQDYERRKKYLASYKEKGKNLQELVSKNPDATFNIELLARVIKMIDNPSDVDNLKQLNLVHTLLPQGSSKTVIDLLAMSIFSFGALSLGLFICVFVPLAIIVGPGTLALIALVLAATAAIATIITACAHDQKFEYNRYEESISCVSSRVGFFSKSEMMDQTYEKKNDQKSSSDVVKSSGISSPPEIEKEEETLEQSMYPSLNN
jgi:hypothetical protein